MKTLITLFLSLFCASALAQNHVTASITVTNATTNGMTLTVNGNVRAFTNSVVLSSVQVLTNADATGCGSKTNLFNQIALNPFTLVLPPKDTGSNTFALTAVSTNALVVTASAGWASVAYSTQTVSSAIAVRVPVTIEALSTQTNIDSGIVAMINGAPNTNQIQQSSTAATQLLGTTNTQTVPGQKTFSNTNNTIYGVVTSVAISGNSVFLTNGVYWTPIFSSPISSNLVNYGNAISSHGPSGSISEQFGNGAQATNDASLAVGAAALSYGNASTAVGSSAIAYTNTSSAIGADTSANGNQATAVGGLAEAFGDYSTAIGANSFANANSATAIGNTAISSFQNSTAIGAFATTTAANQVMLGSPGSSAVVPNTLSVGTNLIVGASVVISGNASIAGLQTNANFIGQITVSNADIAFPRKSISSLANGNNAAVPIGTNEFIEVSGPTGSFTINGIANGRDGKLITILNQTGFQMTIANESGTDPTAANRIRTLGAAADLILTNAAVNLQYNANVSRWIVISHNP